MRRLISIAGENIAFTGKAWLRRTELQRMVSRLGGTPTPKGAVTKATTVLVRGESWAVREYGKKERKAAELVRKGSRIALVHEVEFRKLIEEGRPARVSDHLAGQPFDWLRSVTNKQFRKAAAIAGPLDREHSVRGRVEQSFLRGCLFGDSEEWECSLCGRRLPLGLLVAAHIKPRSDCSRSERLDALNVVFSLCLLGCDALYERGLVAVGPAGRIMVNSVGQTRVVQRVLRQYRGRKCTAWKRTNTQYFYWHLKHRFQ